MNDKLTSNMNKKCIICNDNKFSDLFIKNNFKFVTCINCGLIFINPSPRKKELDMYYKNFNYNLGFTNEHIIRNDSIKVLNDLNTYVINKGYLLDIGCGAGFFIDEARKRGWSVTGVDTSIIAINYAKKKLHLNAFIGDINHHKLKHDFDLITLIQVIEHIPNPARLLRRINHILKSKGLLYIATPNINSVLFKVLQTDFNYLIPPEHIVYYSSSTLCRLLKNNGFNIIKSRTWGYPSDLSSIIKKIIKRKSSYREPNINTIKHIQNDKNVKNSIKNCLFENILCASIYKLLNINSGGSILEVYAEKK